MLKWRLLEFLLYSRLSILYSDYVSFLLLFGVVHIDKEGNFELNQRIGWLRGRKKAQKLL